ncbi:hypothetical protein [Streptomyces sp. NPDC046887]|uniref:hypothetical protein n=1 Tax=Streptomyces sp. NPDC046887 TaxID=3155472 RepID=UPI0033FEA229
METPQAPSATPAPADQSQKGFTGCAVAMVIGTALFLLGAYGFAEFEKGLDGYGQLENGGSGDAYNPLGPGSTARWEDGMEVTVSAAQPEADGSYSLTVTYDNDTDTTQHPGGEEHVEAVAESGEAPLVIRAGKPSEDYYPGTGLNWTNREESADALIPPLAEDDKRTVPVRLRADRKGVPVTVEVRPPGPAYRDAAYFRLTLG